MVAWKTAFVLFRVKSVLVLRLAKTALNGEAGANVGLVYQLTEAIQAEGANPRKKRAEDHRYNASDHKRHARKLELGFIAVVAGIGGRAVQGGAADDHYDAKEDGRNDAEPAQNLDLSADVIEHFKNPLVGDAIILP